MRISTLDIGGMYIKSALWQGGEMTEVAEEPTATQLGAGWLLDRAANIIAGHRAEAVGVSIRGQVDSARGVVIHDATYPDYCGMAVGAELTRRTGLPVTVDNDVNCAALAEGRMGAARGADNYLCVTVGSGVGGAIVLGGKLWRGQNHSAGEFGLMSHWSPAGDPLSDTWERHASAAALLAGARALDPALGDGRAIEAALGRPPVAALVDSWARTLAAGLRSLIHIFDPPCLVLGGGLMGSQMLFERVRDTTRASLAPGYEGTTILPAALGNRAGLAGAFLLAGGDADESRKLPEHRR